MSPRALTEEEKDLQKQVLLDSGKQLIIQRGVSSVSVDDIIKEAQMAKGTFYNHFSSKEELLMNLVWEIYSEFVAQAQRVIENCPPDKLRQAVSDFIKSILQEPAKVFFFINHDDLEELLDKMDKTEIRNFNGLENQAFGHLLQLAKVDLKKVRPEVVHNCIHAMYFTVSDKAIDSAFMEETIEVMLGGLLTYIFGEEVRNERQ